MNWIGLDAHQSYCVAVVKNDAGEVLRQDRIPSRVGDLEGYFREVGPEAEVAMEAGGSWPWIYDAIRPLVRRVALGHPLKIRLIGEARIKNDAIDAGKLSDLLRAGLLPEAYAAPASVRDARQLTRSRVALVHLRTGMKFRVRSLLRLQGLREPKGVRLFGPRGRSFLEAVELPPHGREALGGYVRVLDVLDVEIAKLDARILRLAEAEPACTLLQTIPGIGVFSSALLVSEIGDVRRFATAGKLCAWAGMVPSLYASGGVSRHGPITKQGNVWVRWVLCECVTAAVRGARRFRNLYERVRGRCGRSSARLAVAREMLTVAHAMLRSGEVFDAARAVPPPRKPPEAPASLA